MPRAPCQGGILEKKSKKKVGKMRREEKLKKEKLVVMHTRPLWSGPEPQKYWTTKKILVEKMVMIGHQFHYAQ